MSAFGGLGGVEQEAAAGEGAFGLGQLRGLDKLHLEADGCEALAGPGEGGCDEDRVADADDVGGGGLRRIDLDAGVVGKGAGVDPFGVDEQRVVRDGRDRRLEVEAAAESDLGHLVAVVGDDRPQLIHCLGVAAGGETDVDVPFDHHHVAAVEDPGRLDVGQSTMWFERPFDRRSFAAPGPDTRPRDDRDLVEHERNVLDEHRIGEVRFLVEVFDPTPEVCQHPFVEGVLGPCDIDIDRFALEVRQLAVPDVGTDTPGYCDKHPVDRNAHTVNRTIRPWGPCLGWCSTTAGPRFAVQGRTLGRNGVAQVRANGIDVEVEAFGDPRDPTILLIMGISFQLVHWPDGFVEQLVGRGFHVVRFDNRDVGLSTWFDDEPRPKPALVILKSMLGLRPRSGYTLRDMSDDAVGVLDALGIDSAHVVGVSMGGMIGQRMAIDHPERVRSLCSIMSSTAFPKSKFRLIMKLVKLGSDAESREERIDNTMATFRLLAGTGFAFDEKYLGGVAVTAVDRAWHPAGADRQSTGIVADGDRRAALAELDVPTTVVHGTDDRLILPKCGQRTADAVQGAEMVWIDGMGHEWPEGAWPAILDAITDLVERAGP